ncbi:neuraminidase-like domain-containing protein [Ferviditalea candida]|uniref:Neuraminidase-like domain-containing protein n=1 Tax=Ferviditalea candida TaxID=3108399 RepID=A0ABU5ZM18_9BACL|nr:neuraminidase-like domain-containing protein [Paenibacillaceae bacterium T2]
MDLKIDLFKSNLKSVKQQKTFENIYKKNNGNWSAIKSELAGEDGFTPAIINNLEFTHRLAKWSNKNNDLISVFKNDDQIHSMRDIAAKFNKAAFIKKVEGAAPAGSEEDKKAFALDLYRRLFGMEPTAMLVNMIKDPQVPILNDAIGGNVASVLEKQPDFNIKTASIYTVIKNEEALKDIPLESRETVIGQLKTLQRIAAVSPDTDALPVLYNANLHSAMQISAMPQTQFMAVLSQSGLDDNTLMQIHANAQQARVRNEQAIMALREAGRGTGVAMIDKSMNMTADAKMETRSLNVGAEQERAPSTLEETLAKHNLSWDLLFGDADFCECGECNSVYSAASYYVELLQYLRNNNLDPDPGNPIAIKSNPKDISGSPLEKLFDRRPDLGCLELTCQNTNTVLPYIDLVNEVMENYVAFKRLKPFNVEDEASSELLAEPQHTEYQAYCILKHEVYPFTLPYHQPIDAARIYLNHLDTSRYELIQTFRKNNSNPDAELARLKDEALDRAADAEFLGLIPEQYVILTKECFESKALMEKLKNKILTDDEYRQMIGVKPVCKYYGFDDDAAMLGDDGLTLIKKQFLRRTGIDYFNLVDLLKTEYINPCMPKGKSKTIMESLHFSYRFMQNYAKAHGMDQMAEALVKGEKLAELAPLLKEQIELLTNKATLSCPGSSGNAVEVSDKDIIHWVKCHFEKAGKMIVIESGRGCVNGRIEGARRVLIVEDCRIFIDVGEKKIEIGSIDPKTGQMSFENEQPAINKTALKDASFVGDQGEKGVFLVIGDQLHLVFPEQKDSCDLDTALLRHLDGTPLTVEEYDRIHRFIRLWRRLGWTIDETDRAIAGLGHGINETAPDNHSADSLCDHCGEEDCGTAGCDDCEEDTAAQDGDINPNLIRQLAAVKKLLDQTGLELIKLLSFWNNISTAGEKPLYQRLFLTHNVLGIDDIFKANDKGNYLTGDAKLLDHLPVVMASLNLSADDIQAIMKVSGIDGKLTLDNMSILYRYRLLSKVLGLRIPAFIRILPLFGNVFQDAHATLEFMERWGRMEESGFTHQQLNYIIRDADDEMKPFAPAQKDILLLSKTLYDGLNAIDEAHKDLQADASITDPALQQINIQEQATGALIRTKTGLLFESDAVEKIMGLLEGTNVFTTNAPKNVNVALPDSSTLNNKLKYDKTLGAIQITGILTESEAADFNNINGSSDWAKALTRIQKQQDKLFKELLSGVFENEQTKTEVEKAQLEAILKSGDIRIPLDNIPEGEADPNTAPPKRAAFLEIFLPYLRRQLSRRFIIDKLADFTGLDVKITDALVSEVLKLGSPAAPIYGIFEKIKESAKPDETNWSGYLIPAANTGYTFIVKNSDTQPTVSIDGEVLDFTAQEDPTNEWWSGTMQLQAGKLYKLATTGAGLANLFWKTPASAITFIPSSALIPDFASKPCEPALIALKKAAILVSAFELSADEIRFLDLHPADFDNLDFNALTLVQWLRLEATVRLRNSLPQAKLSLLEFWNWVNDAASDETDLVEKIVDLTAWQTERIEKLIAANHFNIGKAADYRNEKNLLKLQEAITAADKIGMDLDLLFEWAVPVSKFSTCRKIADGIKNAIRAKYNQTDWEQVVKPLNDRLRNNQKDALIGYLLQQKELIAWNVADADGLFEYFLIDVQMDACMETSRIKQAISSVQLFVQRCFLGLEEEHNGIKPDILDRSRWDWMQRYRVWEANRKVFLYPENWIESNLRDDKSPFFKELESELLQKDINKQNVIDALKSYLYKVDEVANMEVVGLYIDGTMADWKWSKDSKLHVFSRTRNAPYLFYYRYLALDEMNWYPWEKMQIDIPSYDVEDPATHEVTDNGCYLIPVVWNKRLLVFFPQIMKKTKPNPDSTSGNFNSLGNDSDGIRKSKPITYYEIKMAWSEYRNGKWKQKQISKDAVLSDPRDDKNDLQYFKFVPIVYENKVLIDVDDNLDSDGGYKGAFEFNGTAVTKAGAISTESISIDYFNQDNGRMYSWQIDSSSLTRQNTDVYFYEQSSREIMGFESVQRAFNHPDTRKLLGKINLGQLELFFKENLSMPADSFGPFDQDDNSSTPDIYHELKRSYSLYNWELFFHTPILLADALSKAQQFEEAMKWFHFVFNPIADENEDNRFWQFKPFKNMNSQRILDSIFNNLKPNTADNTINEWRNKPFMPHVVARSRPVAYMKWVVMKYIDNLLAWGDYLFRQDTIETINQATLLYVLAGHILGPRPMMIPKRGQIKPQTYLSLLDKWDAFGNAMVELELAAPFSNQTDFPIGAVNHELAFANIFGLASSLYFCIPNNPKLMGYWDTLADRLYKIRHCQNIEGVFRKLPLFEPPIDPALLVKAAAQGLSIASVLNDLNSPMPNYRFYYLLQKALELCNELKSMGSAMLSAIEKKDNETLALIRAKHEGVMQNLVMEIKKKQLEEAQKNLESLMQNRKTPEARMKYYLKLSGLDEGLVPKVTADFNGIPNEIVTVDGDSGLKLIPFEKEDMDKASEAANWQEAIGATETIASIFNIIPSLGGYVTPIGVGATATWGGSNLGSAASAVARGMQTHSNKLTFQSTQSGKKGGFTRALQERIFQANAAGYELKQIDKQITAQQIRIDIANQDITNQQKAIDNANEVEEFIKNKYSSEELYTWMRGSLKTLYHQVYNLAYELAKKAEKTYCFERGISSANFIQSGYFDAGRDGLLAGEQLYVGLKQLEAAYQNERGYDYEITKQISLSQINPLAIIQLREIGKCEFALPEVLFDMDYPGHYKRRIKSVSISIPCIAGPYTGINATLRLLENKFRNTAIGGKAYEENTEETDDRFSSYTIPINAIAASSAQNDSGMFELNFKDERYLPFEGAGVISKWRLELPAFRQFDYHTIAEVIIHLKYTSCEGGERLKSAAAKSVSKQLESMEQELNETGLHAALNLKHDLPNEWLLLKKNGSVDLKIDKSRLPYMAQTLDAAIEDVMFVAKVKDNPAAFSVNVDGNAISLDRIDEWKLCRGSSSDIDLGKSFALSVDPALLNNLEELIMVVKYSF